eukprot:scaffold226573_cov21-Tisochrysis_lutea.AAC.1
MHCHAFLLFSGRLVAGRRCSRVTQCQDVLSELCGCEQLLLRVAQLNGLSSQTCYERDPQHCSSLRPFDRSERGSQGASGIQETEAASCLDALYSQEAFSVAVWTPTGTLAESTNVAMPWLSAVAPMCLGITVSRWWIPK